MILDALAPPEGGRIEFTGACNQCGLCCTVDYCHQCGERVCHRADHVRVRLVCEHLRAVRTGPALLGPFRGYQPLGTPMASRCGVYERRVDGMRIRMLDDRGRPVLEGICAKDSWIEDRRQWERIGQGCALQVKLWHGQLVQFTPDPHAPKKEI